MITTQVFEGFESLWRRHIFDTNLTYGQAFAQYAKCAPTDPLADFLYNAPYPAIKAWIEEQINGNKKTDKGADAKALHKDSD